MKLKQVHADGQFFDGTNTLVAFDPSVYEAGPGALLIQKDAFLNYLKKEDLDIVWTVIGEKTIRGGRDWGEKFKGRLDLSAAYRVKSGALEGQIGSNFITPHTDEDQEQSIKKLMNGTKSRGTG